MKKVFDWMLVLVMLSMVLFLPVMALAEGETVSGVDWTPIIVAVIGMVGTVMSAMLARVWMSYVKPWLEQKGLSDAAVIVVDAVEALLGRYCGEDKWALALDRMRDRGYDVNSDAVLDALKAAWKQLDLRQIAAGEKILPADNG